jgi:hypothetical protein
MAVHTQFPVSTTPSESQRLNQVPFEEGALADVAPDHLLQLVPGMLHDVALVGPGRRGRGREPGAKGVATEFPRSKAGVPHAPLQNQRHSAIAESLVLDHSVLPNFSEHRPTLDLGRVSQASRMVTGQVAGFRPFGDGQLSSLPFLIGLRPPQGED